MIFFALGAVLYALLPYTGTAHLNSVALFVLISGVLLTMYGGGFATIPAYLKDLSAAITSAPFTADCLLHGRPPASSVR
jgi:hypothetical protein